MDSKNEHHELYMTGKQRSNRKLRFKSLLGYNNYNTNNLYTNKYQSINDFNNSYKGFASPISYFHFIQLGSIIF